MPENETIDVRSLMEEIERRVQERIAKGEFTEEEIQNVEKLELSIQPNVEDLLDEIKELAKTFDTMLAPLNDLWVPHVSLPQPGIKGKVITLIQKLFSPLTRILFSTQMEFNAQVVRSFNDLKVYLARIIDLTSNLAYRHYLTKIQREMEKIQETQQRLFRLTLRSMNQHKSLRKDLRFLKESSMTREAKGVLVAPTSQATETGENVDKSMADTLYLSFEDLHRGDRKEIMERQKTYLPHFKGCRSVLDVGCGRGEFLELLKQEGIQARGIDINATMVDHCRNLGLEADEADALRFLSETETGAFDGIFCAQVIEHLSWEALLAFMKLSYEKLAEGGRLLMETINPQCLTTFSSTFYLDPTHTKPVHPLTLQFACKAIGFTTVDILYTSPFPDEMKLQEVDFFRRTGDISDKLVNVLNNNVIQLNELLYGPQDYAVLAIKGEAPLS
ncbi:MAG: class I SAM-dependent methyltransferase [Deltaproteobacteria bacterium]|nr:class I SAM-dependent methyltransferase [Deltaproteobacteria bacterium]